VIGDLGRIPSMQDWFKHIMPESWMGKTKKLDSELELA